MSNHAKSILNNQTEKNALDLAKEKSKAGHGDKSDEELSKLQVDLNTDQSSATKIIALQNQSKRPQQQKSAASVEENVVKNLNKKHAVVHTDRFYILTEKKDPVLGGMNFTLESKQSFKDVYENQSVEVTPGQRLTKANIWLKSPSRRQYEGIVFHPDLEKFDNKYYNIWQGFAVKPKNGCCEKYKFHVKDVICGGKPEYFNYVWKWVARLVQEPHKLAETAIVLSGGQGTGKNTFVNPLGQIFGGHYMPLDNIEQLLGKFNFHLKNAVLVHGNEALWGGNRREIGKLKASITEQHKAIEGKGKDIIVVPNFTHLILSSNEDWPVHIDPADRRFFVLKVIDLYKEDRTYFNPIYEELKNGGIEALLYALLHEDISGFDPREIPQNIEAFEIKMLSTGSCERYILESLKSGCFDIGNATPTEEWKLMKSKKSIFTDYVSWCLSEGIEKRKTSEILGKSIKKLIPSAEPRRHRIGEARVQVYIFPELPIARKEFQKAFKVDSSIWE